ncbi:MAG: hypothetical protein ACTSW1_17775 [Candidatus Hodarchaeales archaeon]
MLYPGARGARNGKKNNFRMPTGAKWYHLYEENEDFKLWFDNLARGSPTTAVETTRYLYRYLKIRKITLDQLTEEIKGDQERFEKSLRSFVGDLEDHGYAPGTIRNYLKAIRSWSKECGVLLVKSVKISNKNSTPTLDDEKIPTLDQLQEIRTDATPRGRVCIGGVAFAGLRTESLGHQRYEDGLKLGDLPELDIENLEFTRIPTQVIVRENISKAGHQYRTFFPEQTCDDIIKYLYIRRKKGEELTVESPLVAVANSHVNKGTRVALGRTGRHVTQTIVSRDIRKSMRPKYKHRPYVLRSYFSTRTLQAQNEGVVNSDFRSYWMGHKGRMSARYSTNKTILPEDLIEDMRAAYENCVPYLCGGFETNETDIRRKVLLDTMKLMGAPQDLIDLTAQRLENSTNIDETITEITESRLLIKQTPEDSKSWLKKHGQPKGEYTIVSTDEQVLELLKDGWSYVKELQPGETPFSKNEKWILPDGTPVIDDTYVTINETGQVEMRGDPETLNQLIESLNELGVQTKDLETKNYLMKRIRP